MSTQAAKLKNGEAQSGSTFEMPGVLQRIGEYPRRLRQFLHEVRVEMKQVTWPTQSEVRSTTVVVIITTVFFAVFLWLVDLGMSQVVQEVFKFFKR